VTDEREWRLGVEVDDDGPAATPTPAQAGSGDRGDVDDESGDGRAGE
jgi:hypothetical protein